MLDIRCCRGLQLHHPLGSVDAANSDDVKHTIIDGHAVSLSSIWPRAITIPWSKVLPVSCALGEGFPVLAELETL
jgi:hypothetical protein